MTHPKIKTLFLFALLLFSALLAPTKAEDKTILIDVRTPAEYQAGHIQDAKLIPFDKIGGQIDSVTTDKSQAIELYCRSGRRAEMH